MDIFERATRKALRYPSLVGDLTTEQLWDLPLTARRGGLDLDTTARTIFAELKSLEEGSFVKTTPDPRKSDLELQLDIVKFVIADKIASAERAQKAAENAERKRKLLAALSSKQEAELLNMSAAEIEAEIAKIAA